MVFEPIYPITPPIQQMKEPSLNENNAARREELFNALKVALKIPDSYIYSNHSHPVCRWQSRVRSFPSEYDDPYLTSIAG